MKILLLFIAALVTAQSKYMILSDQESCMAGYSVFNDTRLEKILDVPYFREWLYKSGD
jgi:hypothetical protein